MKKLIVTSLIILAAIFILLEVCVRIFSPEYVGNIQSSTITGGYHRYNLEMGGGQNRVPNPDYSLENFKNKEIFLIVGRSITDGNSTPYEDIYWVQFMRMLNLITNKNYHAFGITDYDNGQPEDAINTTAKELESVGSSIKHILFNFTFTSVKPEDKKRMAELWKENIKHLPLQRRFGILRYKYFHYSALMNLLQINIKPLLHKRSGTCEERGLDALGEYSWTLGNKSLKGESESLWKTFENKIEAIKKKAEQLGASFTINIAPVLMDIDLHGRHPKYNTLKMDLSCATIDPRKRLQALGKQLGFKVVDPTQYLRNSFETRLKENNFVPYYILADTSHITPTASGYTAEYLTAHYLKQFSENFQPTH